MSGGNNEKIDILNRDGFVNHIIKIVDKISDNKDNMTFTINGDWGCGKTFVLEKIQERLENYENDKFLVIPYNCWKYDYYEEPLVAIVAALLDFEGKKKVLENKKKELKEIVLNVGLGVATSVIKNKLGVDLGNFQVGLFKARDEIKNFDKYYNFKKSLEDLKKVLKDISNKCTIVFAVDELDRCLPEYAIKVLERLHHVSEDVSNMVTIIAVDKKRLRSTIGKIFGFKNTDDYLEKFINFEMPLDKGILNPLKFSEKFPDFYNRFNASLWKLDETKTTQFIEELFQGEDIRSQEKIVKEATIFNDICFKGEQQDHTIMCMELFIVTLYHLCGNSIFEKKNIFNSKNIFALFANIPKKFTDKDSGFNFTDKDVIADGDYTGIVIDEKNVFMIIFLYFYDLIPKPDDISAYKGIKYRPYIKHLAQKKDLIERIDKNITKQHFFKDMLPYRRAENHA